jgi:hypothetical protein
MAATGPFGRTLDLRQLAEGLGLGHGLPERVTRPFGPLDFRSDEVVRFTPLGAVSIARGNTAADTTAAFAALLAAGYPPSRLQAALL